MREYSVYVHISPSGKRYVGITCCEPEKRWSNGKGYKCCSSLNEAIKKYGWDNFSHQILIDGLCKESAEALERQFIDRWNTANPLCGYNLKLGNKHGESAKKKIGDKNRAKWKEKRIERIREEN